MTKMLFKKRPINKLGLTKQNCDELRSGLLNAHFDSIAILKMLGSLGELEDTLCGQRGWIMDEKTGSPNPLAKRITHPIIFYNQDNDSKKDRGLLILDLIRRSIASCQSSLTI